MSNKVYVETKKRKKKVQRDAVKGVYVEGKYTIAKSFERAKTDNSYKQPYITNHELEMVDKAVLLFKDYGVRDTKCSKGYTWSVVDEFTVDCHTNRFTTLRYVADTINLVYGTGKAVPTWRGNFVKGGAWAYKTVQQHTDLKVVKGDGLNIEKGTAIFRYRDGYMFHYDVERINDYIGWFESESELVFVDDADTGVGQLYIKTDKVVPRTPRGRKVGIV